MSRVLRVKRNNLFVFASHVSTKNKLNTNSWSQAFMFSDLIAVFMLLLEKNLYLK